MKNNTINKKEIEKFSKIAEEWWDPEGKFKPLHKFNPIRISYIKNNIISSLNLKNKQNKPLEKVKILDIGCGGGLLSEPMARLGANVVGADAAEKNIPVAKVHAQNSGLEIDYRHTSAEEIAKTSEKFDVVLNMEVIEHVADPLGFLTACKQLLEPNGLMLCSTINRNPKSYLMAIIGAEHVMRWLPKGTHDWNKFITPDELFDLLKNAGFTPVDRKGFVFNPLKWSWAISNQDLSVNYVTASINS